MRQNLTFLTRPMESRWFRQRFRKVGSAQRAAGEKAYLKSALKFHGVNAAQVAATAGDWLRAHPELDRQQLRALVDELFATDWFDLRSAGLVVLEKRKRLLTAADAPWLMGLCRAAQNWAHVDHVSTRILGFLVEENPSLKRRVRSWARDRDFWIRRAALLSLLLPLRRGEGDFELFAALAEPMLAEKEFFIRKAIGWILREASKKQPERVHRFLFQHRNQMSGLTFREGSRRLPAGLRL
jgi:3-methyladenine DNA glycosylase AlkD